MTITCAWLGKATDTTATYVVRSDADGDLTMVVDGVEFTGTTIATGTNDGIGTVTATGLSPGKFYDCTLSVAGASTISRKLQTMPASAPFKVAFTSCLDKYESSIALWQAVKNEGVVANINQGDYTYMDTALTMWQETVAVPVTGSAASVYMTHHRQMHRNAGNVLIDSYCPQYYQGDDHEVGGEDWDHTVTAAQTTTNVASGGTQAQVDASWWAGNQAMIAYYQGNPANTDSGIAASTDKPSNAEAGTAAAQYPPKYYRFTIGNTEFFVLDCISYKSPQNDAESGSKTMLGATQKQWLKDRLTASTATFKVICSSKMTYPSVNTNGWEKYTTERAEILDYILASVPKKGVIWVCGDNHAPHASFSAALEHTAFCANPARIARSPIVGTAYQTNVVWRETGAADGSPTRNIQMAGILTVTEDYLEMKYIDVLGRTMEDPEGRIAQWRVMAGSNLMIQPA